MRRGDLVTVALQGVYGKPRPALVIQSDLIAEPPSVTLLPVAGAPREKVGATFGRLDAETLLAVNRALAVFLGFA